MNKTKAGIALLNWGFILFACSLPWSNFGISISYFFLLAGLIMLPQQKGNFQLQNMAESLTLTGVFLIFLIPLLYTKNLSEGLHDLNIKLPCLLLGLVLFFKKKNISELPHHQKYILLFAISCLLAVAFSFSYFIYLKQQGITDARKASPFISHIRLSLMAAIAFCYFVSRFLYSGSKNILFLLPAGFLIFSVFYLGWINGIIGFFLGILVLGVFLLLPLNKKKLQYLGLIILTGACLIFWEYQRLSPLFKEAKTPKNLPAFTLNQREYFHDTLLTFAENGNLYGLYYQAQELESEWKKRSTLGLEEKDARGNFVKFTCFRYLTSKGLPKDSSGIWQLSVQDLRNIEKGIPNYFLVNLIPFEVRLYEFFVELQTAQSSLSVDGHSMGLRTVYWNTGIELIKENFLLGVGTGNVPSSIQDYYEKKLSHIDPKFRNRTHNQYITTFLNSGILGFLLFMLLLILPLIYHAKITPYYLAGWIILLYSMIGEDTLETQAGVGLFIWVFLQGCFLDPSLPSNQKNSNTAKPQFPN